MSFGRSPYGNYRGKVWYFVPDQPRLVTPANKSDVMDEILV